MFFENWNLNSISYWKNDDIHFNEKECLIFELFENENIYITLEINSILFFEKKLIFKFW